MGHFNLLEEQWIVVMTDDKGSTKEVSLIELFQNAHAYKRLAGETPAQDFALLRFLLAILHTVFSRFDDLGEAYEWIALDEKFVPKNETVDEDDESEYNEALFDTWKALWNAETFPEIIGKYLEKWSNRFNLYDENYPFYQITEQEYKNILKEDETIKKKQSKKESGVTNLRLINRLISESDHKIELFSPTSEKYKNILTNPSLVRWLIAFQGYTGTAEKKQFPKMTSSGEKGWLLSLGGIYLQGTTIKETLLLNMVISNETSKQTPIWEKEFNEKINDLINKIPNNLAELYTIWSRLIVINHNDYSPIHIKPIKLPKKDLLDFYLEKMTLWQCPKTGNNKGRFIPKSHPIDQSFWRSFGHFSPEGDISKEGHRRPGIIDWQNKLANENRLKNSIVTIVSVGLSYNRDASQMVNDEVFDEINIHNEVLADVEEKNGWVINISKEISKTKYVIDSILKGFASEIKQIRNLSNDGFVNTIIQDAYFAIDLPFRKWLSEIKFEDDKNKTIQAWRQTLHTIIMEQAQQLLKTAGKRDFIGVTVKERYTNIEIAHNTFAGRLHHALLKQKGENDESNTIQTNSI